MDLIWGVLHCDGVFGGVYFFLFIFFLAEGKGMRKGALFL